MRYHKNIAITADDYGPHPSINAGILEAISQNKVTSVGVLTNTYKSENDPSYQYDLKAEVKQLIACINGRTDTQKALTDIGIGVHLTLSSGSPLTKGVELMPFKPYLERFQNINEMALTATPLHLQAVKAEIKAQILALKSILDDDGIQIDHISCHHGLLFLYGPYYDQLIEALNDLYPPADFKADDKPVLRSAISIGRHKPWKRRFGGSLMQAEGRQRAKNMIDDNLPRILNIGWGTLPGKLKKRNHKAKRQNMNVLNYFFDNVYKKATQSEFYRVFKNYPQINRQTAGEIVLHLANYSERKQELKLHGIDEKYLKGRDAEKEHLLKFDLYDIAAHKGIHVNSFKGIFRKF